MTRHRLVIALGCATLAVSCVAMIGCAAGDGAPQSADEDLATEPADEEPDATGDPAPSGRARSSGGPQPTLRWDAVDGASQYSVVVTDARGVAFWGWQGPETEVTVGEGAPDPFVSDDMTWSVLAYDDVGDVRWDSGPLPIDG